MSLETVHVIDRADQVPAEQPAHDHNFFVEPNYPDVDFNALKVDLEVEQQQVLDPRNPFVVLMEEGKAWVTEAKVTGTIVTPEELVQRVQRMTGANLNEGALKALRGLARDTITRPKVPKPRPLPRIGMESSPNPNRVVEEIDPDGNTTYHTIHKTKQVIEIGHQILGELQVNGTPPESIKE